MNVKQVSMSREVLYNLKMEEIRQHKAEANKYLELFNKLNSEKTAVWVPGHLVVGAEDELKEIYLDFLQRLSEYHALKMHTLVTSTEYKF